MAGYRWFEIHLPPAVSLQTCGPEVKTARREKNSRQVIYTGHQAQRRCRRLCGASRLLRRHRVDEASFTKLQSRFRRSTRPIQLTGAIGYYSVLAMTVNACELEATRAPRCPRPKGSRQCWGSLATWSATAITGCIRGRSGTTRASVGGRSTDAQRRPCFASSISTRSPRSSCAGGGWARHRNSIATASSTSRSPASRGSSTRSSGWVAC